MTHKTVIVIGGGLAGLAAGCYAQANGFDCILLERHREAGGLAATWTRGDYVVEGGPFQLAGTQPGLAAHGLYRELGLLPGLRLAELPVLLRVFDEARDRSIDVIRNLDRLAFELKQLSPEDEEHIDEIVYGAKSMGALEVEALEKPVDLMGLRDKWRRTWGLRRSLRFFAGFYAQPLSALLAKLSDDFVKAILRGLAHPDTPLWRLLMTLSHFSRGDLALPSEGSISMVRMLEETFLDRGGTLHTEAEVAQILVEPRGAGQAATGVRLADGEEMRADHLISAADAHSTVYDLLDGRFADDDIQSRFRDWPLFKPLVMVSLGLDRSFAGLPAHTLLLLRRPFFVGEQTIDRLHLRIFNYAPSFAPPGKTVVQGWFESDWRHWNDLAQTEPEAYDAEKERMAQEVIRRLEYHFPNSVKQVEMRDVATPFTTWRYTHNLQASYSGWLPTPRVAVATVPRRLPGLDGLYLAGHWVMPGGGVPAALRSGRQAVQLVCHAEGRPFSPDGS